MIKIRITFTSDEEGLVEYVKAIDEINKAFKVVNISKTYSGRGNSKYNSVYIDAKVKEENI